MSIQIQLKYVDLTDLLKKVKLKMLEKFHGYLKIRGITSSLVKIYCHFFLSLFTVLEPIKYLAWKNEKGWERVLL